MNRFTKFQAQALGLLVALAAGAPAPAQQFAIDPAHSSITFSVRHLAISKVRGSFGQTTGTIVLDTEHPERSHVRAVIDAASLDTHNADRDAHLKSADFLDVANYPTIVFESRSVRRENDAWFARGQLTLHGVTREIEIPFHVSGPVTDPWGNTRIAVTAGPVTIDRRNFGVVWNKKLDTGGLLVGNAVEITIELEAVKKNQKS